MQRGGFTLYVALVRLLLESCVLFQCPQFKKDGVEGTIYRYGALTIDGQEYISFGKYKGKTILFVNYLGKIPCLEEGELAPHGLVILAFPSNQFGKQEPGENSEILPALKYVRPGGGFVPNFQLFQKGDVNGEEEQKFYTFLKNSCPPVVESFGDPKKLFWEPLKIHDIKWNFEKFLVGPTGRPVMRWGPRTNLAVVKNDIIDYMKRRAWALGARRMHHHEG
uniref:glutathione peroxidase n=1 Tax=Chelonoidis abingdonii TaxID=106734 RepID=A0A8C0H2U0_CHEAB